MPHNTWSDAMFTQAKQDFYLAALGSKHLLEEEEESFDATICMLLQMFFEKYAKAVYHLQTGEFPPKKHKTAKIFLDTLRGSAKYCKMKKKPFFVYCCNCIEKLEKLQPANAKELKGMDKSPQLEYPWSEDGVFFFTRKRFRSGQGVKKRKISDNNKTIPFC